MSELSLSLRVKSGPGVSDCCVLPSDRPLSFGRLETNDCVFSKDAGISRQHFEIYFQDGKCWIKDLGSRNGTYVNNSSIISLELNEGDEIRIGDTTLIVGLNQGELPPTTPSGTRLEPRARLLVQDDETTTIVANRHLYTARIPIESVGADLFADAFNDLPGRAILVSSKTAKEFVALTEDVVSINDQALVIFAPSIELQKTIAQTIGHDSTLMLNHSNPRTQLISHIQNSFEYFCAPGQFLAEYRERPQELANALLNGIDLVVCESDDPDIAAAVFEKQHANWLGKIIMSDFTNQNDKLSATSRQANS